MKTLAFIKHGKQYSCSYSLELYGGNEKDTGSCTEMEVSHWRARGTKTIIKKTDTKIRVKVLPVQKDVECAFYIYKDGKMINKEWYNKKCEYVLERNESFNYVLKYFLKHKNDKNFYESNTIKVIK